MTRGALIFAFNNEHTDYVRMAAWSAERIHRYLDIPVAVVTNAPDRASELVAFDKVITAHSETGGTRWFEDYQATVSWHNAGRTDAYNLTPWDETLVLDADYVVNGSLLIQTFDVDTDFLPQVQQYLKNDWAPSVFGKENVCSIGNYTTFGIARKGLGRILRLYPSSGT